MKILIVLPAYNEELVVVKSTRQVLEFCQQDLSADEHLIVIANNKSNDRTRELGEDLARRFEQIEYLYLDKKGKGLAWRSAFQKYSADIYIVMDIDLAVDLRATKLLIEGIKKGNDLVIGSRYLKDSQVQRSRCRDFISKVYRFIVRKYLATSITDFQCGFKAINNKIKQEILPKTKDDGFFLDTELLMLAEKQGYKIKEVPVNWSAYRNLQRKSTVNIFETTIDYLKKVWELKKRLKKLQQKIDVD